MGIVLVAAATFLLCWLLDKGFQKAFRSAPQHMSGKSVRLNKYNGLAGVILTLLGIVSMLFGVLPALSLLRKTPSEILSKYDI